MRKELRIEGARFERALGFVFSADRKDFSWIRRTQENLPGGVASDARDLRGAGLREMSEDPVPIDGKEGPAVAGASQKAAVGSEPQGVNDVLARGPKLFRRAVGADAVNTAGEQRGKRDKCLLRLSLSRVNYATSDDASGSLRGGNDGAGSLNGALFFANRGGIDGAIGGHGKGSDFAFGSFVQNEILGLRCGGIFGALS